jgi:CHAT domain-containing protein
MPHSYAQQLELVCRECGVIFWVEAWVLIDGTERPDLVEGASQGRLHSFSCPNHHAGELDLPILFYLPGRNPPVLFSPANYASAEQNEEQANELLDRLRKLLGAAWEDTWIVHDLDSAPRPLLALALTEGIEAVHRHLAPGAEGGHESLEALKRAAATHFRRSQARRSLAALDGALEHWRQALDLTHEDPRQHAAILFNIGVAMGERHAYTGELQDIDESIRSYRQAVKLIPLNVPDLPESLNNLGSQLVKRYNHHGADANDLESALNAFRIAVRLTPRGSPNEAGRISNLATALHERYTRRCKIRDLHEAIEMLERVAGVSPHDSPDLAGILANLGSALNDRYAHLGDPGDLDAAIRTSERAGQLTPKHHDSLAAILTTRGNALRDRYLRAGDPEDLDAALRDYRRAIDVTPAGSFDLLDYWHNLSGALRARYSRNGAGADLKAALRLSAKISESQSPASKPNSPAYLTSRGNLLSDQHASTGTLDDLEAAIRDYKCAAEILPPDCPQGAEIVNNLATALQDRYARTSNLEDLNEAIRIYQQAIELIPLGSPQRAGIVSNLGAGLMARHSRTERPEDLEEAIRYFQQALDLTPEKAALDRPMYLGNLASALHTRYTQARNLADLEDAISKSQQAVTLTPMGSPDQPARWNNLGTGLRSRYMFKKDPADLEKAIAAYQQAVYATAKDAPDRPLYLFNLGTGLRHRFELNHDPLARRKAIAAYRQACKQGLALWPEHALTSSRHWGMWALTRRSWKEAAKAFEFGLRAIELIFRTQLLRGHKEVWLRDAQGLHGYAAYAFARSKQFESAVLAMEQGNGRMLSEALALDRAELETLDATHPDLVARYDEITTRTAAVRKAEIAQIVPHPGLTSEMQSALQALDRLIAEIRQIEGYGDFLRPPDFQLVKAAAQPVPLLYVAVTPVGGLALLVDVDGTITPAWLQALTEPGLEDTVLGIRRELEPGSYLGDYRRWRVAHASDIQHDADSEQLYASKAWRSTLDNITSWLWNVLVGPVTRVLVKRGISRVVLIPQGLLSLLPLHAAWTKDAKAAHGRRYALDMILFSYAPNALALHACQISAANLPTKTLFAVEDPTGSLQLSGEEVSAAVAYFPPASEQTVLGGPAVDRDSILRHEAFKRSNVLHFATHGQAGFDDALQAGLAMSRGERLALRDILQLRLNHARLAVLSACETGIPGTSLPDEIVSLPAGFVQAGVAGVIGSLWAVYDSSTLQLVRRFYELWRHEGLEPSEALRQAQIWLRDRPPYDAAFYWATFAYTGV